MISELLKHDNIVIQCHNHPDADTIASAFGVYTYLKENGKNARIIYSGPAKITKPNLLIMVEMLKIPIEHVKEMPPIKTLVMADCQYGESNAVKFEAENIFVFDHHEEKNTDFTGIIRSSLGSCSTLIWSLLANENFDFEKHPNVANALYYGLYTDTCSLEEIAHPLDKDMRDSLRFDQMVIDTMRFNNLTIDELTIAGNALACNRANNEYNYAIFKAAACDQNILGFISDLALQVEKMGVCIVYNTLPGGFRLSIRSCTRELMANEFAAYIAGGGGHKQKAGGYIPKDKVGEMGIDAYIENKTRAYFESYDLIDADSHSLDLAAMHKYVKRKISVGHVPSTKIFPKGTPVLIRTLEGDEDVTASDDTIIMIGIVGEVYPCTAEFLSQNYIVSDEKYTLAAQEYSPTAKNKITGDKAELLAYAKACTPTAKTFIYAAPLIKNTKLFTKWTPYGYMSGKPGDYIAVRGNNPNDVTIIAKDIFHKTYDEVLDRP